MDEVAEISPLTQLALLRVIQDRQFERVGGEKTITTDVRILAATNKHLAEMVGKGLFREDLYYRLNVVRLEVPSLRQRVEDIPFLANHFLSQHREKLGKNHLRLLPGSPKPPFDLFLARQRAGVAQRH